MREDIDPAWFFDWKTKCSCGGMAKYHCTISREGFRRTRIKCEKCGKRTTWRISEAEAWRAWMKKR